MATVLIADDEPAIRQVLSLTLSRLGHHVLAASDGEEALLLARAHEPDLVVSDVAMPRRTGTSLLAAMSAHPRLAQVPVILVSAQAEPVDAAGAFAFLPKPFRLLEFEQVIENALV
ncbi:MAG: response regulator [Planctomycetes bacterium]|nr:response regulator [Planctomycetota bacterium]